jgi:hypothetical protein
MRVSKNRYYLCEQTGEIASPYCRGAREKMKSPKVILAFGCGWSGCVCGCRGEVWRELTAAEAAEHSRKQARLAADIFGALMQSARKRASP